MKTSLLLPIFVLTTVATAQTLDGINAPASRTVSLPADEATFTIAVAATLDSTQAQVKQALQNAGLPNPTVVATGLGQGASTYPPTDLSGTAQITYSATATVAAGSALDTAKSLESLRITLPAPLKSLQYSVLLNPSQATVDAMRQVVLPQLLDDARKLAQSLAASSGVKLGAIRAVGDSVGVYAFLNPAAVSRNGDFSKAIGNRLGSGVLIPIPSSTQYTFGINVVFATVQ